MAAPGARRHPLFDHPEARAEHGFWSKVPFYSADEATALWLNFNPDIVNPATLAPYARDANSKEFERRKFLITRAITAKEFPEHIPPRAFNAWCNRIGLPLPTGLHDAMVALLLPEPATDILNEALLRLARLERAGPPIGTTERNSMLALIGSMAIDKYGYNHGSQRQKATKLVRDATERAGLPLSTDTVHKYLSQAAEHIAENRDDNPNSD